MVALKCLIQGCIRTYCSSSKGARACLVDRYALMRSLEAQGFTSIKARIATDVVLECLNNTLEKVDDTFARKTELEGIQERNKATLALAMLEGQTAMDQSFSWMEDKLKNFEEDMDEELQRMMVNMEKELNTLEREREKNLNGEKYDFLKYTAATLTLVGSFSFAIGYFL